ncbi:TipAS antibiotic-recognition domain-containing protein [Microbacteriaceae bacterium VKM Ac-2855]|nr:TipAS antibiotic-recognition domain-containing protein [Microbacteriaceae bacterium VKM Ac-2855]
MTARAARDWSIQEIARIAGTTSRTLRHYGELGILAPTRIGTNGYRYYDQTALLRLQRILLLRELGLGLPAITEVLRAQADAPNALESHLTWLQGEQERLARQISAVETTIRKMRGGEELMADEMFDGFDHTQYKDEVEQRWGSAAYADSDRWWRSMSASERADWQTRQKRLAADWTALAATDADPSGEQAQRLAERHAQWLGSIPGTPRSASARPTREYLEGLAEMYVADERFAANYGGTHGAAFVREALLQYAPSL